MSKIYFNGKDLKATYNFVVQRIDDPHSIEIPSVALQSRDGEIFFDDLARLEKRIITLSGQIYGTSHADVMSRILGLKKLIASSNNRGKLEVEYNDGGTIKTKYMYVQLAGEIINTQPIGARAGFLAANLTVRFTAIDKPYWIVEGSNNNIVIAPLTNLKYDGTWRKDLKWKLEPYTVVNLLGKYGDFETEGGTPGLADGWEINGTTPDSKSLILGLNGNAQRLTHTLDGSGTNVFAQITKTNINLVNGNTYFFEIYVKRNVSATKVEILFFGTYNDNVILTGGDITVTNRWERYYGKYTATEDKTIMHIYNKYANTSTGTVNTDYDMAALYNLTAMGTLPYGLQQYFAPSGITKWEDLATASNIEALDERVQSGEDWLAELLPYVNGIASLGFAWEGI